MLCKVSIFVPKNRLFCKFFCNATYNFSAQIHGTMGLLEVTMDSRCDRSTRDAHRVRFTVDFFLSPVSGGTPPPPVYPSKHHMCVPSKPYRTNKGLHRCKPFVVRITLLCPVVWIFGTKSWQAERGAVLVAALSYHFIHHYLWCDIQSLFHNILLCYQLTLLSFVAERAINNLILACQI